MTENTGIVAWSGRLELVDAIWSLKSGRIGKFSILPDLSGERPAQHPFAGFVKRRGNRVGTRFHMTLVAPGFEEPAYDDEVMLKGGATPLTGCMTVDFWLSEDDGVHQLAGYQHRDVQVPGQEFAAVFVELGHDGRPIDQTQRNQAEKIGKKDHSLSRLAALLGENPLFHEYLAQTAFPDIDDGGEPIRVGWEYWAAGNRAAAWVRVTCEVNSRGDFDRDDEAAVRFHERVRKPYLAWCAANGYEDRV